MPTIARIQKSYTMYMYM